MRNLEARRIWGWGWEPRDLPQAQTEFSMGFRVLILYLTS